MKRLLIAAGLILANGLGARALEPEGKGIRPLVVMHQPRTLGVTVMSTTRGVTIRSVIPGSAAHRAGLETGDVIIRVDGFEVGFVGGQEFPLQSELRRAGNTVTLEVIDWRNRRPMIVEVRLEESPPTIIKGPAR